MQYVDDARAASASTAMPRRGFNQAFTMDMTITDGRVIASRRMRRWDVVLGARNDRSARAATTPARQRT